VLAVDAFDGYLTETYGPGQDDVPRCGIDWNDEDGRTAEQVTAALNAAADRYEHTHRHLAARQTTTAGGAE
jgi:hypothetical protein